MIKGKFYAGLTSEMMTRARTVNRQQTNFFWPDETDAESATPGSKRTVSKNTPSTITNNNNTDTQTDIKPKELVRKQLSSGIEFYDNVNAKTTEARRRRFKKIDNINLNNNDIDFQPEKKKLETFSSKIEFYDFEHENNVKNEKIAKTEKPTKTNNANERRKDEVKIKNESPEVNKKRISFQTAEKTKSILKNSDEKPLAEKVVVKPFPKRGLLPKNLSKSFENISKLAKMAADEEIPEKKPEKLSTIIKEVKSLNLSNEANRRNVSGSGRDEGGSYHRGSDRPEPRRSNVDRDYDRGYRSDRYENRDYHENEYRYKNEDRIRHNEPHRYDNYYDDYSKGEREYVDRRNERFQRDTYSQSRDPYKYRDQPRHYEKSSIRDRRSPNYDRFNYDRDYETDSRRERSLPIRDAPRPIRDDPRKPNDRYYNEPSNRSIRYEEEDYSSCISSKPKHIPQHLRTNILSNGKVRQQAQRPMSVRNSAVTRVGVGLPDFE